MNLWIDSQNGKTLDFTGQWYWAKTVKQGMDYIRQQQNTNNPVTSTSVSKRLAPEFFHALEAEGIPMQVFVHGTSVRELPDRQIAQWYLNKWDRKVMDTRTAELIMVIKGRHDLHNDDTKDLPQLGNYIQDIALYLSDDCQCPFSYYVENPACIESVVREAVLDYMKASDNPSFVLWQYFENKRLLGDVYNDTQLWCSALVGVTVRQDQRFVNGFNAYNTKPYSRKAPIIP